MTQGYSDSSERQSVNSYEHYDYNYYNYTMTRNRKIANSEQRRLRVSRDWRVLVFALLTLWRMVSKYFTVPITKERCAPSERELDFPRKPLQCSPLGITHTRECMSLYVVNVCRSWACDGYRGTNFGLYGVSLLEKYAFLQKAQ